MDSFESSCSESVLQIHDALEVVSLSCVVISFSDSVLECDLS